MFLFITHKQWYDAFNCFLKRLNSVCLYKVWQTRTLEHAAEEWNRITERAEVLQEAGRTDWEQRARAGRRTGAQPPQVQGTAGELCLGCLTMEQWRPAQCEWSDRPERADSGMFGWKRRSSGSAPGNPRGADAAVRMSWAPLLILTYFSALMQSKWCFCPPFRVYLALIFHMCFLKKGLQIWIKVTFTHPECKEMDQKIGDIEKWVFFWIDLLYS